MAAQQHDVIDILVQDHREVEEMFQELEGLRGRTGDEDRARRKELVDKVTIELVRHAVAEETQVYPVVKQKVSEEEAERAKREHAEAEKTMKQLERLDPEDTGFDDELATLMREIREHVAEEEGVMFAHMRETFSPEELQKLGSRVEAIKKIAPTRPHPMTPNDATVRLAVGPAASLFDRLRDAVSGRGSES
jgi:hemerythrin superfamily protein